MRHRLLALPLAAVFAASACAGGDEPDPAADPAAGDGDLGLGDVENADGGAADGWGFATTCKTIPYYPPLPNPEITISFNGLTLHLVDRSVGYDKVFPVGVGAIDTDAGSTTFGESLSMFPPLYYGKNTYALKPSTNTACKIWWTDPATGQKSPVFAGLPFLSWSGSYAIHGPIDNFTAANGGNLRRGFVSHGCVRMEAADILEVYARVKDKASVPVRVQREPERTAAGVKVDVPADKRWMGGECAVDADCGYANALCKKNAYSDRGFCTQRCTSSCPDKAGYPTTFCVADPDAPGKGMCVLKHAAVNDSCRPYDHFQPKTMARNGQPSVTATVCMPGSPGWVGSRCLATSDCKNGTTCNDGLCTQACTKFCADMPGFADTFCVNEPDMGGPVCLRQCTPETNGAECSAGTHCVVRDRNGGGATKAVCELI